MASAGNRGERPVSEAGWAFKMAGRTFDDPSTLGIHVIEVTLCAINDQIWVTHQMRMEKRRALWFTMLPRRQTRPT